MNKQNIVIPSGIGRAPARCAVPIG